MQSSRRNTQIEEEGEELVRQIPRSKTMMIYYELSASLLFLFLLMGKRDEGTSSLSVHTPYCNVGSISTSKAFENILYYWIAKLATFERNLSSSMGLFSLLNDHHRPIRVSASEEHMDG